MASLSCYGARALLVAFLALFASAAQAQTVTTLVSNLEGATAFTGIGGGYGTQMAQQFTVASDADYTLTEVIINVDTPGGGGITVGIRDSTVDGKPSDTDLYTLTATSTEAGYRTFTAPANAILEKGKSYFVVVGGPSDNRAVGVTERVRHTGISGWSIADDGHFIESGETDWSTSLSYWGEIHILEMRLRGYETPASPQARLDSLTVTPVTGTFLSFHPAFRPFRRGPYTAWVTQDATEVTLVAEKGSTSTRVDWPDDVNPNEPGVQIAVPAGGTERYRIPVRSVELPCTREDLANGFCTWYWLTVRRQDGALTGKLRALPPPPATRGAAPPHLHRFRVKLSAPVELSLEAWKNDVFTVSNGTITDAKRIRGAAAGPGGEPGRPRLVQGGVRAGQDLRHLYAGRFRGLCCRHWRTRDFRHPRRRRQPDRRYGRVRRV